MAITEARVWHESGSDLLGYVTAESDHDGAWRLTTYTDYPMATGWTSAEDIETGRESSEEAAEERATRYAIDLANQAITKLRAACDCQDGPCGVLSEHGYSLQVVREDRDITAEI